MRRVVVAAVCLACPSVQAGEAMPIAPLDEAFDGRDGEWKSNARRTPVHFPPLASRTDDSVCLACHWDQIFESPRVAAPAGLLREDAGAWYQELSTYAGRQESFHWRHYSGDYARDVLRLRCNTCHHGHDPLEQAALSESGETVALRKRVNPMLCLKCHGRFPDHDPLITLPWEEARRDFDGNCLVCHAADAARRHQARFLARERIERRAAESSDVCYGCHGGRAWYRVSASAGSGAAGPERGSHGR
jgi:hypothetical protein